MILRNTNGLVADFRKIGIPFGLLGVSVDSVGADNSDFITYLSEHAKFILVRDTFSRDTFSKRRNKDVFLAPDLTFLYPYLNDPLHTHSNSVALSLRPWKPNLFKQYTKNYHRFNKLANKFPFLVSILGLWDPKKFIAQLEGSLSGTIKPFPLHINPSNGDNLLLG